MGRGRYHRGAWFAIVVTIVAAAAMRIRPEAAGDPVWNRIDTPNFVVIGTSGEKSLTDTGLQFEGFREALSRILSKTATATAVPTVIIAFPNEKAFEPFRPVYNGKRVDVVGQFLPRQDVNYVLLGPGNPDDAWRVVFHEYTHLIVNNVVPNLAPWLDEGLAEYYSSVQIGRGGREVLTGKPIDSHYRTLGQEPWLPVSELIETTHESSQYNEGSRRSVFYAESWLLTHMLMNGQPDRSAKLAAYVDAFESNVNTNAAAAWDKVFAGENIDAALKRYASRPSIVMRRYTLSDQIARASGVPVAFAPADVEATFGDLCLAVGDKSCAAERFRRALALNPSSARAAIGAAEASDREYSGTMPAPSDDWFTDYMTAAALVHGTARERAAGAAAVPLLEHAAHQHPVANMYGLIAEAAGNGAISAADIEGLRQARGSAPARDDYAFALARALTVTGYYADAREVLGTLIAHPHWPDSRDEAMRMMRWIVEREQRLTAANSHPAPETKPEGTAPPADSEPPAATQVDVDTPARPVQPLYREVLKGEERAEGLLERVDCDPGKPAALTVRYGSRVQRYQAPRLTDIEFISYRSRQAGRLACGPRVPPDRIYLTWRRGAGGVHTPVAVEFLPFR